MNKMKIKNIWLQNGVLLNMVRYFIYKQKKNDKNGGSEEVCIETSQ